MIAAAVIALLACAALAYVGAPLRDRAAGTTEPSAELDELEGKKRSALTAILDIEGERDAGKLSNEDFAILRAEYETEAMTALLELDALRGRTGAADDALESEIAAVRRQLAASSGAAAEPIPCPSCGASRVPGRPCGRCGD